MGDQFFNLSKNKDTYIHLYIRAQAHARTHIHGYIHIFIHVKIFENPYFNVLKVPQLMNLQMLQTQYLMWKEERGED